MVQPASDWHRIMGPGLHVMQAIFDGVNYKKTPFLSWSLTWSMWWQHTMNHSLTFSLSLSFLCVSPWRGM